MQRLSVFLFLAIMICFHPSFPARSLSFLTWWISKNPPSFPQNSQTLASSRCCKELRLKRRYVPVSGILSTSSLGGEGFQFLGLKSLYLLGFPSLVWVVTIRSFPCRSFEAIFLAVVACLMARVFRKLLSAKYMSLLSPCFDPNAKVLKLAL